MAISSLFPSSRPSLSLDFAKSRRLDPRISFARTQTGNIASYTDSNGLIRFAGPDAPRFDYDPVTGESLGLLIEEQRTNLVDYGNTLMTGFNSVGITRTPNASIAPDGTNSATEFIEAVSTGEHYMEDFLPSGTGNYTHSIFIKKANSSGRYFRIRPVHVGHSSGVNTSSVLVDLDTESFVSESGIITSKSLTKYPNGWFRLNVSLNIDASTTSHHFRIQFENPIGSPSSVSYTGDGTSSFYVWGAQVEQGSFPTSYIPTSGTAVTRPADIVSIRNLDTADWWDPQVDSFSMVIEWDSPITLDPSIHGPAFGYVYFWSNSTNYNDRLHIGLPNGEPYRFLTRSFGAGDAIFNNGTVNAGSQAELKKMAFKYSIPDYSDHTTKVWKIYYNSGNSFATIAGNLLGTVPPNIQRLGIGNNPTIFNESPGIKTFKKLSIYNSVLPDSILQTLTK